MDKSLQLQDYKKKVTWRRLDESACFVGQIEGFDLPVVTFEAYYRGVKIGQSLTPKIGIGMLLYLREFKRIDEAQDIGIYLVDQDEVIREYAKRSL